MEIIKRQTFFEALKMFSWICSSTTRDRLLPYLDEQLGLEDSQNWCNYAGKGRNFHKTRVIFICSPGACQVLTARSHRASRCCRRMKRWVIVMRNNWFLSISPPCFLLSSNFSSHLSSRPSFLPLSLVHSIITSVAPWFHIPCLNCLMITRPFSYFSAWISVIKFKGSLSCFLGRKCVIEVPSLTRSERYFPFIHLKGP